MRARARTKPRGARGYGTEHQRLRRAWDRKIQRGGVPCGRGARCLYAVGGVAGLILPGMPWDLGHDDHDRSVYTGPEHARCNRVAAGRKAQALRRPLVTSRVW